MSGDERFGDPHRDTQYPGGNRDETLWGAATPGFPDPRTGLPSGQAGGPGYGGPGYGGSGNSDPRYGTPASGDPRYGTAGPADPTQLFTAPPQPDRRYPGPDDAPGGDPVFGGPGGRPGYDDGYGNRQGHGDGYQDAGPGRSGPNRKIVIAALLVAVLAAVGTGLFVSRSGSSGEVTTAPALTPSAATTSPAQPSTSTPAASTTAPTTKTSTTTKAKAPTGYVSEPWDDTGMDFGIVSSVQPVGDGAVITVDRAEYLVGDDAAAYFAAHPDLEPMDYVIANDRVENLDFRVEDDALLYGQYLLGDRNTVKTTKLSMTQFLTRSQAATGDGQPLLVWLYHTTGDDGPVVYLAEQFMP